MRQLIKSFLCVVGLVFSLQSVWAFSLLGPVDNGSAVNGSVADTWQVETIGFNPISSYRGAPPYLGTDSLGIGPKNISEGYRRNTPVIYYGFDGIDGSFAKFFGVNGEQAVDQAFDILNNVFTNNPAGVIDGYSSNLVEFPLQSQEQNYNLTSVELLDLKSTTLSLMMEQLGLADAIRYTWVLHNRYHSDASGAPACPADMDYLVVMRNFDIVASPLNQPQYSAYINDELYTYFIPVDLCDAVPAPPDADAVEQATGSSQNYPVASGGGMAAGSLKNGYFYTGLTRDDVGGLRYLYSSTNINMESMAPGSTLLSGGGAGNGQPFQLTTSNLAILSFTAPATLQTLFPSLVILSVTTNIVNGQTNYSYTFENGNLVTNSFSTTTMVQYQIQTTTIQPLTGWPLSYGKMETNTVTSSNTFTTNMVSGDFYVVPTNYCGLNVLSNLATISVAVTNVLGTVTNQTATNYIAITSTNIVTLSTNHLLWVSFCTNAPGTTNISVVGNFQGIEKIQFVRVPDQNIDPLTGNFYQLITNTYTMMFVPPNSSQAIAQTFQRVLTRPDILFAAADLLPGPGEINDGVPADSRSVNFNQNNIRPGLAGPGTIDPSTTIYFNKVGPVLENNTSFSAFMKEANASLDGFIWGSFDGSTNDPTVYPNGTSIATLESEALIQISPATLPDGTNTVPYSVILSVTGGGPSYTWMLATNSATLPLGLTLISGTPANGATISGTPTNNPVGLYDFTVQMNDSSARSVQKNYSITIH